MSYIEDKNSELNILSNYCKNKQSFNEKILLIFYQLKKN